MSFERLLDPTALALVIGGTILATLLRCGLGEIANTGRAILRLFKPRFSEERCRSAFATQAQNINREGLLRANLTAIADKDFADGIATMLQKRLVEVLVEHHAQRRAKRERVANEASRLLSLAADLGPVFGLAGTLVALTQLPRGGLAPEAISGVVSSAVLTTLYGVLSANLVYGPLARQIARVSEREELDRQALIDWLVQRITTPQIATTATPAPKSRMRAV